ncbi:hypothetical protein N7474_008723 [Penicillium riverlandense]|uniref:uncharacterized protein n=1 Tax=Penicillium riverlandense TaxID=1903569 RepID=UPI0025483C7F|nr:uncharacterized protein N7474_008723 [Penicillium riverlandense]KAJ5812422.1 hypothetical protein N7474_008723 [Penicillium riverlandense]
MTWVTWWRAKLPPNLLTLSSSSNVDPQHPTPATSQDVLSSALHRARRTSKMADTFASIGGVRAICVIVFISIALYNAAELLVLIILTFKRYRSLYFWALLLSSLLGVIPASIGSLLQFFNLATLWLTLVLENIGFYFMVPGQSVVLYSRLHLVSQNQRLLRFLRWLITINTIILIIPITVLNFGWSYHPTVSGWAHGFDAMERIQLTWFSAQEILISTIYILETIKMIRAAPGKNQRRSMTLYLLVLVNFIAIGMDVVLMTLEYLEFYLMQIIVKALVYSIKLKLEFAVLNMLVSISHVHLSSTPAGSSNSGAPWWISSSQ